MATIMKVREFYPHQVIRRLQGKHAALNAGQTAVLRYAMRRSRNLGYSIMVGRNASATDLTAAINAESAQAVLANCTMRIVLQPSI